MTLREWLHGTKAAAGVRNLESLHTLALFFPMVGMAIATLSASLTYWSSDTVFYGYEGVSNNWYRHTAQNAWYMEPFAAPANCAYWFAGLGLFLMPYLSNDHLPATVFVRTHTGFHRALTLAPLRHLPCLCRPLRGARSSPTLAGNRHLSQPARCILHGLP